MVKDFFIGSHKLGIDPCYIIAEIGSNHDRIKSRAFELIVRSAEAGANAVKFQLFKADRIAAKIDITETRLNDEFSRFGKTVYDLYKDMELPDEWLPELKACCDENGIDFLATPFDEESADRLTKLGSQAIKISSFEITHLPFLKHVGKLGIPILLSTGMASLPEIDTAVKTVSSAGEKRIALFHCGISYPAPLQSVNLRCLKTLRDSFNCPVGYSDHTEGIVVPVAATAMGSAILEKHITLDEGKSPDHDFALNITKFANMVRAVRECELALGSSIKQVQKNELNHLSRGRRSIFIVKDIMKGEAFTEQNLAVLRPGTGLSPIHYEEVLGKKAVSDIKATALLKEGDWC